MNVYYRIMRYKDENKSESIFQATIQLLNEIGFSEISMSKIAKRAGVSPSTIYVYFENKEDMLKKIYLDVKEKLSYGMIGDIDTEADPTKETFEAIMRNLMDFIKNNKEEFLFIEQFANSPLVEKLCSEASLKFFKPFYDMVERGKKQNLLKDAHPDILLTFCYFPVTQLAKENFKGSFEFSEEVFSQIIEISWDAIKK